MFFSLDEVYEMNAFMSKKCKSDGCRHTSSHRVFHRLGLNLVLKFYTKSSSANLITAGVIAVFHINQRSADSKTASSYKT